MNENKMGVLPIPKLLITMAVPMIISMMVQALYNIVDTIYITRVSDAAVNALSLAFPIQNLLVGFSTGIAVGVNSLFSKSLGEKDLKQANSAAKNGIFLSVLAMILFMLFGLFGSEPYFRFLSTDPETIAGGTQYIAICCICSIGMFAEILFERLLQSTGRTIYTMITQATGALINIILDPVFIFGYFGIPAMGVAGAAIATVLGQIVAALLAVFFNIKRNPEVQLRTPGDHFHPDKRMIRAILTIGIPSIIMMAIGAIMNFGMNYIFQGMNTTATNIFGIYYKIQSIFFMPLFGINNATISIIAYNYGARQPKRITGTVKLACALAFCFTLVGFLIFELSPQFLLGLFPLQDANYLSMGSTALRIIGIHFPVAAFCIALGATFQAMGIGIYSTICSLCRQLIVLLPVAYLLSLTGNVDRVWWSFPIAEAMSLAVTVFFFIRIYRMKIRPLFQDIPIAN